MAITSVIDKAFEIIRQIKGIAWGVLKYPFEWWFNLPGWVHIEAFILLCLFALVVGSFLIRYKDQWRYRYNF